MGTPVTSQDSKEIVEGVARVFQAKLEETSTSRTVVPAPESSQVMQKIELLSNDIKLKGTRNYLSWSRRALLNLRIKGLEKYVNGEYTELENKVGAEWSTWSNINSLVVSWLLTSVSPTIARMVESIYSAIDVWKTLAGMYSRAGSVIMMMEVEEKIDATTQGEKTILQYAAELRCLWADLDHYDPLSLQNSTDILFGKQYLERRRVARFLKGLNPQFEGRRVAMCRLPSLPSLDEAVASMKQEEIRQKVMTGETSPAVRSALVVPGAPIRDDRECCNCGKKGHLSFNRSQPRNFGGGRGGRGQGSGRAGRGGRGCGGRGVAHLAMTEESQTTTEMTGAEMKELEELRQFKLQVESSKDKGQVTQDLDNTTYFDNFAGYAHINKGTPTQVWGCGEKLLHQIQETREHTKGVTSLAILQSGKKLFSGSVDKSVKVWSLHDGQINCIENHDVKDQVHSLTIANNMAYFIPQGAGVKALSWNGGSKILNSNKYVKCMSLVQGKLYCGCNDNSIQEIDLLTGTLGTIQTGNKKFLAKANPILALQAQDELLYSASSPLDGAAVKIWNASNYSPVGSLASNCEVRCMTISRELIYLGSKTGVVEVWSKDKHARVGALQIGSNCRVQCMTVVENELLLVGTSDGRIQAWELT